MPTAQPGDRVQVHYVVRTQNGSAASSRGRAPLEVTVGVYHRRLPGLGLALVGLAPGESMRLAVPPERAYGLPAPGRVHRWSRRRFPEGATLTTGRLVRFTDDRGRRRLVRILEVGSKGVVVDANHPWAGQALEVEVELVGILGPDAPAAVPTPPGEAAAGRPQSPPGN
jgi:FKBP-type peptidyl-prolyl cis-trans isomerase 2